MGAVRLLYQLFIWYETPHNESECKLLQVDSYEAFIINLCSSNNRWNLGIVKLYFFSSDNRNTCGREQTTTFRIDFLGLKESMRVRNSSVTIGWQDWQNAKGMKILDFGKKLYIKFKKTVILVTCSTIRRVLGSDYQIKISKHLKGTE